MKIASVLVVKEGVGFACRGIVQCAGERLHETRTFPHECTSNARDAAESWAREHGYTCASVRISAIVTAYEGEPPGPRDWAGYVAQRILEEAPGADVSVSYGQRSTALVYGDDALEAYFDEYFSGLISQWWNELVADHQNEQWDEATE